MDLTVQIVNQEILQNKSVTEEKYLMLLEVLLPGAVNDTIIHLMLLLLY
jgi:hypothetical protein